MQDDKYDYEVNFFDAGSLAKIKKQLKEGAAEVAKYEQRVKLLNGEFARLLDLQKLEQAKGFTNAKLQRAGNKIIAGGGADVEAKAAAIRGELARRDNTISSQIIKLKTDAYNRDRKAQTVLERAQVDGMVALERSVFLDRQINTKKEATLKLAAARVRAGQALAADLNNTDGRSSQRLRRELGQADGDVATIEKQVAAFSKMEASNTKLLALRTKIANVESRAATITREREVTQDRTSTKELRALVQQRSKLRLQEAELNAEKLTTAELDKQRVAAARLASARTSGVGINGEQASDPLDSLNRRLQDGGAGLLKIQAQLLANYAAMGLAMRALAFAGRFVVELDAEFAQLQAITGSTDASMKKLEATVIRVSEGVKFTALEVAEAATIMGQAGFSADQIEASLKDITTLATAVGTDLKTAVDLVTSTISVFNLRAEEAGAISNTFTTAVNNSKLNLEKLTLGLQYAGNIAAEQNITFSELTATLGAMANSGIRSGSTLGTGLRQILTALAAPSEKLQARLDMLGLSTDDVNVKLYGLTGVLKNLQEEGFTTTDALQVLEVRAGAAYAALTNNSGTIDELRQKFLVNAAAAEANAVQMEALANKGLRLQSIFGTVVSKALAPLVDVLKLAVDGFGYLLSALNKTGPILPVLTTLIVAYTAAVVANRAALLAGNLVRAVTIKSLFGEAAATRAAGLGYKGLLVAMGPVGASIAVVTAVLGLAKIGIDTFTVSVDDLKAKVEESSGALDTNAQNVSALEGQIEKLNERFFDTSVNAEEVRNIAIELQQKFGDLGAQFDLTATDSSSLVDELVRLKDTMLDLKQAELSISIGSSKELIQKYRKDVVNEFSKGLTISDSPLNAAYQTVKGGDTSVGAITDLYNELSKERGRVTDRLNALNGTPEVRAAAIAEARGRGRLYENTRDDDRVAMLESSFARMEEARLAKLSDSLAPLFSEVLNQEERIREAELTALRRTTGANGFQTFEARRAGFQTSLTNIQGDKSLTDEQKDTAINALIPQVKALGEEAKAAFETQKEVFGKTGFAASIEGLAHTMKQATLATDAELKEQKQLRDLKKDALNAELQGIKSGNDARDSASESSIARQKAIELLNARHLIERAQMVGDLEKSYASEKVSTAKLEALDNKQVAERQRLVDAFDKVDLARVVRNQGISYKSLALQLDAEISAEKKRVNRKTSVNEIEAAKIRALELLTQKEIAARDDLRFRLRNDSDMLSVEMMKLNTTMAANRLGLAASFDGLLVDVTTKQTPRLKNALTELTNSFEKANKEMQRRIDELQRPVKDLQTSRDAMDSTGNVDNFGDIHRKEMDKEIEKAQVVALKEEVRILQQESLVMLRAQEESLRLEREKITQALLKAESTSTSKSSSPAEQKAALAEIEQLKKLGLDTDTAISEKTGEIKDKLEQVRDLHNQISVITGSAAPAAYSWTEAMSKGLEDYIEWLDKATIKSDEFADVASGVMQDATADLGDAFFDIVTGAKSVGEAFGDLAKSFLEAILKILAEQAAIFVVKQIFAAFGGEFGGGGGGGGGFREGGVIPVRRAAGGTIPNVGVTGRDYTPILAEAGEFMVKKSSVDSIGKDRLHRMNALGAAGLDSERLTGIVMPEAAGGPNEVNVYVMAPEEKPQLNKNDILYIIGEDLATGGQTKQLIKKVVLG